MEIRRARASDIAAMARIRAAVRENRLSDPSSVTLADYDWFVGAGRIWLAEAHGTVAGFAAGDPRDGTIWALFVDPDYEGQGLGAELLAKVCKDLRADGYQVLRLSTDPETKAARLYARLGWEAQGHLPDGELEFLLRL